MRMDRKGSEACVDQKHHLQSPSYDTIMLQKLNKFRQHGMYTDAILCVDGIEFAVHRNVLASSSPYFNAMFGGDLRESRDTRISFNDISPSTMKQIIEYVYSGSIDIVQENAQELLAAGNLMEYPAIVEACCAFLGAQIHSSNSLGIEHFAQLHCCDELRSIANQFTRENFSSVINCDEFVELSKQSLASFISDDSIDVPSEEIVCQAVITWVSHDLSSRLQHLPELLGLVRLSNIDVDYLYDIKKHQVIRTNVSCIALIDQAIQEQEHCVGTGVSNGSTASSIHRPRPSTVAKEVIVAVGGIQSELSQTVEMYDVQKRKWTYLCDVPLGITWCSVVEVNNYVILTGGIVDGCTVCDTWKLDATKRTWNKLSPMLKPRACHSSLALDGYVYVLGGGNGYDTCIKDIDTIDRYDPVNDLWSIVGKSAFPRKQSRVTTFNDAFAEVGGLQGDAKVNTIDCYTGASAQDYVRSSGEQYILPEPIQFSQIVPLNGIYYIIWEDTKKVLALNPKRRTFTCLPDMKHTHIHSGATVLDGKLYITGGMVDSKPSKVVECFDPLTNKWTSEKPMLQARSNHGCVTLIL